MNTGVCYYPEQWPEEKWATDIAAMADLGLRYVRLGEFAWSRIEPQPGLRHWPWLDRVLDLCHGRGLKVVLGTPTATPPYWLIEAHPDILPQDEAGRVRRFGSRRHYCFSSQPYRQAVAHIVQAMAGRYGRHAAVAGWQTDNEYGCHDTVRCYCPRCEHLFRQWLRARYGDIEELNQAWGTVFWSQTWPSFDAIGLPTGSVTTAHPCHRLDYYRFASDQVIDFNRQQVAYIRPASPDRFITHNFMGFFFHFDHFALGADLDLASWDSYPLGFTDLMPLSDEAHIRYARTGHPDVSAFHHDLYRGVGRGRFWVMEQQPGPVNWAPFNPSPAAGMVRLWTWEAFAHGADTVSYFRWRQTPTGQEAMHAGLQRPDGTPDVAAAEVQTICSELLTHPATRERRAQVALVFDYEAAWMLEIVPQGGDFAYRTLVFLWYSALRQLGLDVDIISRREDVAAYLLVLVPSLPSMPQEIVDRLAGCRGTVVLGPRSGSVTDHFELTGGPLRPAVRVARVESLRPGLIDMAYWNGQTYPLGQWKEWLETSLPPEIEFADGRPAAVRDGPFVYFGCWPSEALLIDWLELESRSLGLSPIRLATDLRLRRRGGIQYAFNYSPVAVAVQGMSQTQFLLGGPTVAPHGVSAWRVEGNSGA